MNGATADPPVEWSGRDPRVGIACHSRVRETFLDGTDLARLEDVADVKFADFQGDSSTSAPPAADPAAEARLSEFAVDLDALVVCHGAPRVTADVLQSAPRLRVLGELEGDRFAGRIDVDAATARGIPVVDTTHGSSYPVAEWALALAILGLRGAGRWFREVVSGRPPAARAPEAIRELTGRRVGLIGFGHIAWRLVELLRPFQVPILAYDPYAPRELADALGISFAPLDEVFHGSDVVVCLAPLTPRTRGMIGAGELELLRPGSVFVNVSRGPVVDSGALARRLSRGDIYACLDVFDPEPLSPDNELVGMPNVFCSPHIAGVTAESRTRFFSLMVDELLRFFSGAEPRAQLTDRVVAGRGEDNR